MSVARRNAAATGAADSDRGEKMKAIVQDRFGPPETLRLADTERPAIRSGEVLLRPKSVGCGTVGHEVMPSDVGKCGC